MSNHYLYEKFATERFQDLKNTQAQIRLARFARQAAEKKVEKTAEVVAQPATAVLSPIALIVAPVIALSSRLWKRAAAVRALVSGQQKPSATALTSKQA